MIRKDYVARSAIVFDEKTIADRATYQQPEALAEGMKYVIVNGKVAVDEGKDNGTLAGQPLRKTDLIRKASATSQSYSSEK